MRYFALFSALLLLSGCTGPAPEASTVDDLNSREVKLPGGHTIHVETEMDTMGMLRGLAFRPKLAEDRGMLFVHRGPGRYSYWMFQTEIPLDIIWMDATRHIVEIVPNALPCKSAASQCPHYGGHEEAKYVLEIGAGLAQKYGIRVGESVSF
jgi:uncharacterized membrane protein (UPF0127 family)